jgi:hypothetical protein
MARTATTFLSLFDDFCRAVKSLPETDVTGVNRVNMIRHLNAAYRAAWQYNGVAWEDSWNEGAVAVASGVIAWSAIGDAHVFNLWSVDPRPNSSAAQWIEASSSKAGLFVGETWNAGVFGFWRPVCPQWDGTSTEATMITLLKDATLAFAEAAYWRAASQHATSGARRKDAQDMLEDLAAIEFERVQHHWWLRRKS